MSEMLEGEGVQAPAEPDAAPVEVAPEPVTINHRADAAQAFLAGWLPQLGVSATAFTQADAQALLAAIDAAAAIAAG